MKQQIKEELQNQEEDTKRKDPLKIEGFEAALKTSKGQEVARRQNEEILTKLTVFIFDLRYFTMVHLIEAVICGEYNSNNFAHDHEQTN